MTEPSTEQGRYLTEVVVTAFIQLQVITNKLINFPKYGNIINMREILYEDFEKRIFQIISIAVFIIAISFIVYSQLDRFMQMTL